MFSLKRKLEEKIVNPIDFLKHLKDPIGRTRSAVRVADYLETTLKLLKRKLNHSHLGYSNCAFALWLPAVYEDGVSVPRGASEGKRYSGFPLPLVRVNVTADPQLSLVFMHWGQCHVNHDIDLAPASGEGATLEPQCHSSCAFKPPCFPIKPWALSSDTCMPFMQSASVCGPGTFRQEQLNAATSFIDASTMYGSDSALARSLRNLSSQLGLMAVNKHFWDVGLELLPFENTMTAFVCSPTGVGRTRGNGDKRVTENLGLSAIHTLFVREHKNHLLLVTCFALVFFQIITYRDYLPLLLAEETSKWIPLYSDYNEKVDPRASDVFSLPLIRGMVVDHAKLMKQNKLLIEELQNHLFEQTEVMGLDLGAMNMQWGRDHSLPGYNALRGFCGLSQPQTVEELSEVLGHRTILSSGLGQLQSLWFPRAEFGPLLSCIIGTQFRKLWEIGVFWWENLGVFTPQHLQALRKISVLRVICGNTHIKKIPRDVFKINTYPEDFTDCQEIDVLDLSSWKDEPESATKGTSCLRSVKNNKCTNRSFPYLKKMKKFSPNCSLFPRPRELDRCLLDAPGIWSKMATRSATPGSSPELLGSGYCLRCGWQSRE
uniref:Uncharacterized protein n=1 Tax=Serinus canaria TaxID=9135 RepID=A0A8C9MKZ3_SERCA